MLFLLRMLLLRTFVHGFRGGAATVDIVIGRFSTTLGLPFLRHGEWSIASGCYVGSLGEDCEREVCTLEEQSNVWLRNPPRGDFMSFLPPELERLAFHIRYKCNNLYICHYTTIAILAKEYNLQINGVVPLSEVAVEVSDLISSCLGIPHHNPLELLTARRDKGLMKLAVERAGLRIAKYARVSSVDDICTVMSQLSLSYPIR